MDIESLKETFLLECEELLDSMEKYLLSLEKSPEDSETINALFRAVHTIKGSAGMFGYQNIVDFTHHVESMLDQVRQNIVKVNEKITAALLSAHDHINLLVDIDAGRKADATMNDQVAALGHEILNHLEEYFSTTSKEPADTQQPRVKTSKTPGGLWHISLRFKSDVLKDGLDPNSFLAYLANYGIIRGIYTVTDNLPDFDSLEPELFYLGFEVELESSANSEEILSAFEFLESDADIHLLHPNASEDEWLALFQTLPEGEARAREICNLSRESAGLTPISFVPQVAPSKSKVSAHAAGSTPIKEETAKKYIRIEAHKLDHLINLVGELVITEATVKQVAGRSDDAELHEAASGMSRLIEELRDTVMSVRMVQIGETFSRFERTVHDASRELSKEVNLIIEGGETELDKNLIENMTDPLMHLVRNAIDHGIEGPQERKKRGKPEKATLRLVAYHDTGSIVIEVADDGRGLNREKILQKAVEKGLASPNINYSDDEIYQYILEPGFSTAEKISNISGRGVGMDVVRKNIENMRGTIEIESTTTVGATFRIRLPLTLAIIDGFVVSLAENFYVIPLDMVIECVELSQVELAGGGDFLNLRGEILPFLRMRDFFGEPAAQNQESSVVVVNYGRQKAGLIVDSLLGESQTVIKPLGRLFDSLTGFSGATIMGSGEVALILDVPRLIEKAVAKHETQLLHKEL